MWTSFERVRRVDKQSRCDVNITFVKQVKKAVLLQSEDFNLLYCASITAVFMLVSIKRKSSTAQVQVASHPMLCI